MALQDTMAEVLRLTRSGNLMEATALVRSAIHSGGVPSFRPSAPTPAMAIKGKLIDLSPERVAEGVRGRAPGATPGDAAAGRGQPISPSGQGRFAEHTYRGSAGAMSYRLYVPGTVRPGMPLVVMLHGCTQSPEDFARGTGMNSLADEFGFLVAYPRQTQAANAQKCWNWFKPGDQQRDRGEPALLAGVTREVMSEHEVDPERVYVAGLSAGGAAAAIMAAEYPDLYAAVGIHSGLACGAARDLPSALMAMQRGGGSARTARASRGFVPVITFHGDRDATVHAVNSQEIVSAAAMAAGVPLDVRVEEGRSASGCPYRRELSADAAGTVFIEQWTISGAGHAWAGGDPSGSYTDPKGPQASREMVRFFLERKRLSAT